MSKQSELVEHIVHVSADHPTAEQIYNRAREEIPNLSMGTVYRNLGRLTEEGRIRRVTVSGGADRYDPLLGDHGHLLCIECGALSDIPPLPLDAIERRLGGALLSYDLTARYICPACRKKISDRETGTHRT